MKKFKLGHLYEVEWYDHWKFDDESSESATKESPVLLKSYGMFSGESPKYITILYTILDNAKRSNDGIKILKNCIKSVRELL